MKQIWHEIIGIGFYTERYVHGENVHDKERYVDMTADASWDKTTTVAVIEIATKDYPWSPDYLRVAEFIPSREKAIRRTIQLIDEYRALIEKLMPANDTRTDEQVRRDARNAE